jgi:Flp pilus assembly protein TadG
MWIKRRVSDFIHDDEDGVALVEFAIFLPLFLLSFFVIVEFSRTFFSYQGAIAGVRDATRYLARVSDGSVCQDPASSNFGNIQVVATSGSSGSSTGSLISAVGVVREIITRNMDNEIEGNLPDQVFLLENSDYKILATYTCVTSTTGGFRQDRVPMARVEATFEVKLPLIGILELNGTQLFRDSIIHTLSDESRIYGM